MKHKITYSHDLTALSYEDKLAQIRKLERYEFSKGSATYTNRWIVGAHYFFRLHYVHTGASQEDALRNQKTRSAMGTMYDRYVRNRAQGNRFISERKELLLSSFIALCCINIDASEKTREAIWDLLSTDSTEIRKIFNL